MKIDWEDENRPKIFQLADEAVQIVNQQEKIT